jgi:hypothetical protein
MHLVPVFAIFLDRLNESFVFLVGPPPILGNKPRRILFRGGLLRIVVARIRGAVKEFAQLVEFREVLIGVVLLLVSIGALPREAYLRGL